MAEGRRSIDWSGVWGAIFDADGTLLDSMPLWNTLASDYLRSQGITPPPHLDEDFAAFTMAEAANCYIQRFGIQKSRDQIVAEVNALIAKLYAGEVKAKPGVPDFLKALASRGIAMIVATATDRPLIESALAHNGIQGYFKTVMTCSEMGFGKTGPEIYKAAMNNLGTHPAGTLIFEDAPFAIRTASSAGFRVIGVADPAWEKQRETLVPLTETFIDDFRSERIFS